MKKKRKEINDEDLNEKEEKGNQWWGFKGRRREEINDEDLNEEEEKGNQWWGFKGRKRERKSMMRI